MASGAVHTFIPANSSDVAELRVELETLLKRHSEREDLNKKEIIEQYIEVRADCIGLRHAEFIDVEAILESLCIHHSEIIEGLVRVGSENKFGSMNAMKFDVEDSGELPVRERVSYETNPDEKERTFKYKSIEVINPELTTEEGQNR